jgi:hypothetical protein
MKSSLITLALLAAVQLASAQEKLAREDALKYAAAIRTDALRLNVLPIATDVDMQQPVALRDEDYGLMVLPQKNLAASTLTQATDAKVTPLGQLWLHKLTPMRDGAGVSSQKLRMVTIQADGDEATVPQCALGVKRKADGALELLVFGKEKEPVLAVPMKTIDSKQETPIDVAAERQSESGRITLKILGKYQASFDVTELEF